MYNKTYITQEGSQRDLQVKMFLHLLYLVGSKSIVFKGHALKSNKAEN